MPPGGLLFQSRCTCCEDSCFLGRGGSSLWQSCCTHGALASTCSAVKAGLCTVRRFHTHTGGVLVHKYIYIYIYLMWLCFFELIQYPTEVDGRWVKPTSLLMGVTICMSTSLFSKQTTVLSRLQAFSHLLLCFSV